MKKEIKSKLLNARFEIEIKEKHDILFKKLYEKEAIFFNNFFYKLFDDDIQYIWDKARKKRELKKKIARFFKGVDYK